MLGLPGVSLAVLQSAERQLYPVKSPARRLWIRFTARA